MQDAFRAADDRPRVREQGAAEDDRVLHHLQLRYFVRRVDVHPAAALRDNGGGRLIGGELEATNVERARSNLREAGHDDRVDIGEGDALAVTRQVDVRSAHEAWRVLCLGA